MKTTFSNRAQLSMDELHGNKFPNASTLSILCKCSRNTAQRTIYKLRDEYLVPMDYDASEKGYYLIDKDFYLPSLLPATKEELLSLYLTQRLIDAFGMKDVEDSLHSLWCKFSSSNPGIRRDISANAEIIETESLSSDTEEAFEILPFLEASMNHETVSIEFIENGIKKEFHQVKVEKIKVKDTILFFTLRRKDGRRERISTNKVHSLFLIKDY